MSIATVRRICARVYEVGETRVKIIDIKRASEALTADDVRLLVKEKAVIITAAKAPSRAAARRKQSRKHAGRRRGSGSKKGTGMSDKAKWVIKLRSQRKLLAAVKPTLKPGAFRKLYKMAKGNAFKTKHALSAYIKDNQLSLSTNGI